MGGASIQSDRAVVELAAAVKEEWKRGGRIVIVNGGGKEIDALCKRLSVETAKTSGLRITTPEVLEAVQMSLSKKSVEIATALMSIGISAVPMPALSGGMVRCRPRHSPPGYPDLGLVGEVDAVDRSFIDVLFNLRTIPVIYPIGSDGSGTIYNINADEVASSIASALGATALLLMTDVPGIMVGSSVIKSIRYSEIEPLLAKGDIRDGMIPKLTTAGSAALAGVERVCIMNGTIPGSLDEFFRKGILNGTEIQV